MSEALHVRHWASYVAPYFVLKMLTVVHLLLMA